MNKLKFNIEIDNYERGLIKNAIDARLAGLKLEETDAEELSLLSSMLNTLEQDEKLMPGIIHSFIS
jgi:hypothetical protein